MTSYGLHPTPIASLTAENLQRMVLDMGAEPGWYASAELYRWYLGMCEEDNLAPVSKKMFGTMLKTLGYRPSIRRVEGKSTRCWFLTRRAIRGGAVPGKS